MIKYTKQKMLLLLFISTSILFTSFIVSASTIDLSTHNKTIQSFIDDITLLQNRVFVIAQSALENEEKDMTKLNNQIKLVNADIESLNNKLLDYLATLPSISEENSDTLLIQNALNLVKNALYQINLLVNAPSDIDQLLILQEFFRLRVNAAETLNGIQKIISNN
ncbi:MAG: hypothetical protein ACRCWY_11350 [Cellulosilyticaceae bacterium]